MTAATAPTITDERRAIILRPQGIRAAGVPVLVGAAVLLVVLLALPFSGLRFYYLQVIVLVFFMATLGTSWGIVGGYSGSHSIGHAAFVGVGAYTSTILYVNHGVTPWIGLLAGVALAVALAVVIGYPCFRLGLRGDYFTLATIALGQIAYEVANGSVGLTRGSQGIPISFTADPLAFQFQDRRAYYFVALVMWLGTVVLSYRLRTSRTGFEMLAVRDDEAAAARGGISVLRSKLTAFAISAAIAAVAGTFYAQFYLFIDPGAVMGLTLSIQIVLVATLGGMNSFLGGTVGAIILVPIAQVLSTVFSGTPGADLAFFGIGLVLLMLFMPFGILGLLRTSPRWRKAIGW